MELVEKGALRQLLFHEGIDDERVYRTIENAFTLTLDDLRPTARWDNSGRYRFGGKDGKLAIACTNCGAALTEKEYKESVWNYCPVCGAKMGGAVNEP